MNINKSQKEKYIDQKCTFCCLYVSE